MRWLGPFLVATFAVHGAHAQPEDPVDPAEEAADDDSADEDETSPPDQTSQVASDKPWARGVSPEKQAEALKFFEDGNRLFVKAKFTEAVVYYEQALEHWEHPAIRFNIAVCFMNINQLLDAQANIEKAMVHGTAPLGDALWAQAVTYKRLLASQIGIIELNTRQEGVQVTLDGRLVPTETNPVRQSVLPGEHQIVATLDGYRTQTVSRLVMPGKTLSLEIELFPDTEAKLERRMPGWLPWTVLAAGVAIVGAGVPLELAASGKLDDYREQFLVDCSVATPCYDGDVPAGAAAGSQSIPKRLVEMEDKAYRLNRGAIAAFAIGGTAVAAGLAMVALNQPKQVRFEDGVRVVPTAGPGEAGATLMFDF